MSDTGSPGTPGVECLMLGKQDEWLYVWHGDRELRIEATDANDLLYDAERRHRDDALECPDCGILVGFKAHTEGDPPLRCGCTPEGSYFGLSGALLDTLAASIRKRFGIENVSRNMAREFRAYVIRRYDEAKKKRMMQHGSATGTAWTPEVGVR